MPNRRQFISSLASVAFVGLAGCASGSETATPTASPTATETPSPTATATPTETPSPTATETPSPTATQGSPTPTPAMASVAIEGFAYKPIRLSVEPGTTVEWTNKDGASHDVTSDTFTEQGSEWDYYSGSLGNGAVTSYTFTEAGAYEYYCSIHGAASMCGVVIVGDASHDATLPCE